MGLNVLVIGAGMYVAGRGTDSYGTILPSLFRAVKEGKIATISVASTTTTSSEQLLEKAAGLNKLMGTKILVEVSQDYNQFLAEDSRPDCVFVSTPDHTHFEITKKFIENKVPCMVVKPLAPTLAEVKKLIDLQTKHETYGAVEFHKRFDKSNLMLKEALTSGRLGEPLYFLVQYSQKKSIPTEVFKSWVDQTNIFQYLGIHYVDIIYFVTGATPLRVMALGQKSYLPSVGVDNYDSIQAMIEWQMPSGHLFNSSFVTNWIESEKAPAMSDQRIKVVGTLGKFEANQKDRGIHHLDDSGYQEPNPYFSAYFPNAKGEKELSGYGVESLLTFIDDIKALKSGKNSWQDYEENRATFSQSLVPTQVIEAANQSLRKNGQWITLS
ncbi:MAG: Gfo/Idh/MocA family oxidoreductase [Halobacteriovoraceae bacterium]|jgi:D-galacturonate reductase|nr:Gfo/Idh/MocA family oxidoreductase [Halobacteriovoraceae bacterium]MBT5094578.1 Gfo/Idh/MocA family oxidoreductase [Halobacteriovoraceae bacterium]